MKNILIPIGFNFNSYHSIDYVVQLFKNEACHFFFFNTYNYDVNGLNAIHILQGSEDWFDKPKLDSEMSLGNLIKKFTGNENTKHQFDAISECTELIDGIKKTIKQLHIDLVVVAGKMQVTLAAHGYSKNTKRIIDSIRECPVMFIPVSAQIEKQPEFVLVSDFEKALPTSELENWYDLVRIANGKIKIITLAEKESLSQIQKENQCKARFHIESLSQTQVKITYIRQDQELKEFARDHSDHIICMVDKKPDFWRKCGLTNSKITNLGPLLATPLITLHR